MEVQVVSGEKTCGWLRAEEKGLYTVFAGEVEERELCRMHAVFTGGELTLGVPAPEDGRMRLRVSVPSRCLPPGKLLRGELRTQKGWRSYGGGLIGPLRLPKGMRMGDRFRFPWSCGEQLPCDELMCFYHYLEEDGKSFLEVTVREDGTPEV